MRDGNHLTQNSQLNADIGLDCTYEGWKRVSIGARLRRLP